MNTPTYLNVADQALIVDLLIEASKTCNYVAGKEHYLEIIHRVKGLEIRNPITDGKTPKEIDSMLDSVLDELEELGV